MEFPCYLDDYAAKDKNIKVIWLSRSKQTDIERFISDVKKQWKVKIKREQEQDQEREKQRTAAEYSRLLEKKKAALKAYEASAKELEEYHKLRNPQPMSEEV